MPLLLRPSPVRAPGRKRTCGREARFCFESLSVHLRTGARSEGLLPAPSRCPDFCLPPPPPPLRGLTPATLGSNHKQDCVRASKQGLTRVSRRGWTDPRLSGSGGRAPLSWESGKRETKRKGGNQEERKQGRDAKQKRQGPSGSEAGKRWGMLKPEPPGLCGGAQDSSSPPEARTLAGLRGVSPASCAADCPARMTRMSPYSKAA